MDAAGPSWSAEDAQIGRARAALERSLGPELLAALDDYLDARSLRMREPDAPERRRWLTIPEASIELGCSEAALRKRLDRGWLPRHRLGGRLYVDRLELDRRLEQGAE